ncbi:MAG: AMP-binding protein [Acidobacteria bacterium]|nr:AMP-binding protein [Acidobacteriota bacterium]
MPASAPWLSHYDPGVPSTLAPYPDRTLVDELVDAAHDLPKRPALLFKGAAVTYVELDRLSDACAAAFISLGVKRGDRVALLLPNCPQFSIAQFAAWKIGAIVAPLNPIYTEPELEGPLREHGVETIVTLSRYYPRIKHLQRRTPLRRIISTNIKEFFPPALRVLFTWFREKHDGDRVAIAPGDHDFAHLLLVNRGKRPPRCESKAIDPAVLLMSGGTTGTPKGVLGTHGAYLMAGLQVKAWTASVLNPDGDVILAPLPMFHVYANVGTQSHAIVTRSAIALVPNPRDVDDLLTTIRRVKPAFFTGVPAMYIALLNHRDVQRGRIDFKSIKICLSGSSALLADTKQRFEALTGGHLVEGYSLTEAMMATCINPVLGPNKLGSVGLPVPDVHVRIFDGDDGTRVLATNEVGEIAISAPQLMVGYWNRPEETSGVLRDHVDDAGTRRWLHTGDLGYLDDDGYVFIVDRKKDLIKTSGFQVWPREVEEALALHPAVGEVGVAGVADPSKGEAVKAWVVLRAGHTTTEHDLRTFCRDKLAPYKVPSSIEFRKDLPKTMVGKVLRRALKEERS